MKWSGLNPVKRLISVFMILIPRPSQMCQIKVLYHLVTLEYLTSVHYSRISKKFFITTSTHLLVYKNIRKKPLQVLKGKESRIYATGKRVAEYNSTLLYHNVLTATLVPNYLQGDYDTKTKLKLPYEKIVAAEFLDDTRFIIVGLKGEVAIIDKEGQVLDELAAGLDNSTHIKDVIFTDDRTMIALSVGSSENSVSGNFEGIYLMSVDKNELEVNMVHTFKEAPGAKFKSMPRLAFYPSINPKYIIASAWEKKLNVFYIGDGKIEYREMGNIDIPKSGFSDSVGVWISENVLYVHFYLSTEQVVRVVL